MTQRLHFILVRTVYDKNRSEDSFKILPKLTKGVVHLLRHYLCLDNLFIFLSNCLRFSRIRKERITCYWTEDHIFNRLAMNKPITGKRGQIEK